MIPDELDRHLRGMLHDMSARIYARDISIVDQFWSGGKFWLFGSEQHEHDETREELQQHMLTLFAKPYRVRFQFEMLSVDRQGDMAWLNAPAILEIHHSDRLVRLPYRLFALFQQISGLWHWRVFSGSEPASPPPLVGVTSVDERADTTHAESSLHGSGRTGGSRSPRNA